MKLICFLDTKHTLVSSDMRIFALRSLMTTAQKSKSLFGREEQKIGELEVSFRVLRYI